MFKCPHCLQVLYIRKAPLSLSLSINYFPMCIHHFSVTLRCTSKVVTWFQQLSCTVCWFGIGNVEQKSMREWMLVAFWGVLWLLFACVGAVPRLLWGFGAIAANSVCATVTFNTRFDKRRWGELILKYGGRKGDAVCTWGVRVGPGLTADAVIWTAAARGEVFLLLVT